MIIRNNIFKGVDLDITGRNNMFVDGNKFEGGGRILMGNNRNINISNNHFDNRVPIPHAGVVALSGIPDHIVIENNIIDIRWSYKLAKKGKPRVVLVERMAGNNAETPSGEMYTLREPVEPGLWLMKYRGKYWHAVKPSEMK